MSSFDGTVGDHFSVPAQPPQNSVLSLSAASAVDTAGSTVDFVDPQTKVTMLVDSTAGTTNGVVKLQLSDDGSTWYDTSIQTDPLTSDGNFAILSDTFARYGRAYISTGIVGGTVTVKLLGARV